MLGVVIHSEGWVEDPHERPTVNISYGREGNEDIRVVRRSWKVDGVWKIQTNTIEPLPFIQGPGMVEK